MFLRLRRFFSWISDGGGAACNDLDRLMARATTSSHDLPPPEPDVSRLIVFLSSSGAAAAARRRAFVFVFTRRFGRTRSRHVALKCLVVLHRLLNRVPALRADVFSARTNALFSLHPRRRSIDGDPFISSYSRFLDEVITCEAYCTSSAFSKASKTLTSCYDSCLDDKYPALSSSSFHEKSLSTSLYSTSSVVERMLEILESAIECELRGRAAKSMATRAAAEGVLRESFDCYASVLPLLQQPANIFSETPSWTCRRRAANVLRRLAMFYEGCKDLGLCMSYEYPLVAGILRQPECSTATTYSSSSSPISSPTLTASPLSSLPVERTTKVVRGMELWEKFME